VLTLSLLLAGSWMLCFVAVYAYAAHDEAQPAGAIIVLGAAQYVGRPSPVLRARLDHAVDLFHRGLAPRLILTGGRGTGDTTSEAAVSRTYAMRHGIPDSAILLEEQGRTSNESMRAAASLMKREHLASAILVSDPFHMLRLGIMARRYGITPYLSPTQTSPISASPSLALEYMLRESVAIPMALVESLREPRGNVVE
jgi:uncharacterized SAM-binding protein YcdF (DUF218 family)